MSASFTPELKKMLAAAGCYLERQGKGDHEIWYSPITERRFGWTGRQLHKDSDRVKATRSAIACVPVANLYWCFKVRDESVEEFNEDE